MEEKDYTALIVEAYKKRLIPQWYVFKPFFDWVENKRQGQIRPCHIREMRRVSLNLLKKYDEKHPDAFDKMGTTDMATPFFPYDSYGEDKEIVCILNQIIEGLTNFLILSIR